MALGTVRTLGMLAVGVVYWWFVSRITGAAEPWDAQAYWRLWYPGSCALAATLGLILKERGWIAGAFVTLAQAPVMLLNHGAGGVGPLLGLGVLMLCALAVPATAVSALAAWFAIRPHPQ